jgi:hypothetical protein
MALNSLMVMPFALQLSHGWTSLSLKITIFLIISLVPAIIFMTIRYGALGAAAVWVVLNIINLSLGVPLTHRRLLKDEAWTWFLRDTIPPVITVLIFIGVLRVLITSPCQP